MNRYDGRGEGWRSDAVYAPPRRTVANNWRKFHAVGDCGRGTVRYIEDTSTTMSSDRYSYELYCGRCGHGVDEDDVLFVGGQWWRDTGMSIYGRPLDDLWLPPERVLELGPDPDRDDLVDALELSRIERKASAPTPPLDPDQFTACDDCGHEVPVLFDRQCRMCYSGPWTDRLQGTLDGLEDLIRKWHNNSHVHELPRLVDPTEPTVSDGAILWRRRADESAPKLAHVVQRLTDRDSDQHVYRLADPSHTRFQYYTETDVRSAFWDTGLTHHDGKPVADQRLSKLWRRVRDTPSAGSDGL